MLFESRIYEAYLRQCFHKRSCLLRKVTPTPDAFVQAQKEANDLLVNRDLPSEEKPGFLLAANVWDPTAKESTKLLHCFQTDWGEPWGLARTQGVAYLRPLSGRARGVLPTDAHITGCASSLRPDTECRPVARHHPQHLRDGVV